MSAKKLVEVLGLEDKYREMLKGYIRQLSMYLDQNMADTLIQKGQEMEDISIPYIMSGIENIYERMFADEELDKIIDWYESSVGKKMSQRGTDILRQCDQVVKDAYEKALNEVGMGPPKKESKILSRNLN